MCMSSLQSMDHDSRVGEWKLEFAAAAPLSIPHSHRSRSIISTPPWASLLGYVIQQQAATGRESKVCVGERTLINCFDGEQYSRPSEKCNEV
jgi:hypothetical protein